MGKTPVLLVGDEPIFESAVICEYLDETALPRLHPENALTRARHRAWMEFGSALLNTIGAFYSAQSAADLAAQAKQIRAKLEQVEATLGAGPFFSGARFCMVDAVFGPVFRYFDLFDQIEDFGFWDDLPKVKSWRQALKQRPSVINAARSDYVPRLADFVEVRGSELSKRLAAVIDAVN